MNGEEVSSLVTYPGAKFMRYQELYRSKGRNDYYVGAFGFQC